LLLFLLATLAAIGLVLQLQYRSSSEQPVYIRARELHRTLPAPAISNPPASVARSSSPQSSQSTETIGTTVLRDYANPNTTPEHDLALLGQLMDNFTLLVKTSADRPLSANEDWSQALRGLNPSSQRFLPDDHIIFNSQQQLIDRWGTPLFFHAEAKDRYSIRSAGPDRRLWTSDDLQRNPDGSLTHGGD
jgi:hypothetical protein